MPDIPAEAVRLSPERVIEVAIGLYDGPRSGASAPRLMAKAVLANLTEYGFVVASPDACPSAAPESTQSPETPEVAPVYRPGVEHPAETLSALRGRYAAAIDRVLDQPNGYAYRGTLPDAVLAVRDDELSRALRIADYHADQHRQAADAIARVRAFRDYLATATEATETGALLRKVARNLSDMLDGAGAVPERTGHSCGNCEGIDPASCINAPRPPASTTEETNPHA